MFYTIIKKGIALFYDCYYPKQWKETNKESIDMGYRLISREQQERLSNLYCKHRNKMWAIALNMTEDVLLAEQAMVESMSFILLNLEKVDMFQSANREGVYFYLIARYAALRLSGQKNLQNDIDSQVIDENTQLAETLRNTPILRDILFMNQALFLSVSEIAVIINASASSIEKQISAARIVFKQQAGSNFLEEIILVAKDELEHEIESSERAFDHIATDWGMGIPKTVDLRIFIMISRGGMDEEKEQKKERRRWRKPAIPAVAAALILCIGTMSLFVLNPDTAVAVKNFLYQTMKIPIFNSEGNKGGVLISANSKGVPSHVPSGYQLVENTVDDEGIITLHYEAGNEYLTIKVYPLNYHLDIDNENAIREEDIKINEADGLLIEKDGTIALVWFADQRAYRIKTTLPADKAIRVAKSI